VRADLHTGDVFDVLQTLDAGSVNCVVTSDAVDIDRVEHPLLFPLEHRQGTAQKARELEFSRCSTAHAVLLTRKWHSRLPNTQAGPWQYAFKASRGGLTYAVALWNNPSARTLPPHWLELRRMACSPDAPKYTASRMLGWMVRYFRRECPERERCISYQDTAVHLGTIYKAANWTPAYIAKARVRDRSKDRVGTHRAYRSNLNGPDPDAAEKVRWEMPL